MTLVAQQIINGIMLGSVLSMVALGLTLMYGILNIPNFAHGHVFMLGAYVTFFLLTAFGVNYWLAMLVSIVAMAIVGIFIERLVFRPIKNARNIGAFNYHVNPFIGAMALLIALEAVALILFGPEFRRFPNLYDNPITFLDVTVTGQRLIVIGGAIVFIVGLQLLVKKTLIGSAMDASSQNREGAQLVGINPNLMAALAMAIGCGMAAAAGSLIGPIFLVYPTMGGLLNLKAFVVVILGGLGSIPGAIIGGLLVGLIEALGGGFISSDYKDVFAFAALAIVLMIRPAGLFGKETQ